MFLVLSFSVDERLPARSNRRCADSYVPDRYVCNRRSCLRRRHDHDLIGGLVPGSSVSLDTPGPTALAIGGSR